MSICVETVLESAKQNPFFQHIGFKIVQSRENELILKLAIQKKHHNVNSSLHGGIHAAMIDSVQTLALRAAYHVGITCLNLNIHYVSAISDGFIYARARIIQLGYKTATVEAEIVDSHNQLIAKGSGVYKIIRET